MAAIRAFLAIDLDANTRTVVAQAIDILKKMPGGRDVRWISPENTHLTLRFLGNIQISQTLTLKLQMQKVLRQFPPFRIELGKVGLFPSMRNPKVVAIDIVYSQLLQNLFTSVEKAVVASGFPGENRPARPHISIARIREDSHMRTLTQGPSQFNLDLTPAKLGFRVHEVVLFQSITHRDGVKYIPIDRIALA